MIAALLGLCIGIADPPVEPPAVSPLHCQPGRMAEVWEEPHLTRDGGVYRYHGQKETWYNLPMDGVISIARERGIEGEYHVREDGVKMYGDYIIIAADYDTHPYGSIVETSLGDGIVLDTGSFAAECPSQVDIAVEW